MGGKNSIFSKLKEYSPACLPSGFLWMSGGACGFYLINLRAFDAAVYEEKWYYKQRWIRVAMFVHHFNKKKTSLCWNQETKIVPVRINNSFDEVDG